MVVVNVNIFTAINISAALQRVKQYFHITKFQEHQIVMSHRKSKTQYAYHETASKHLSQNKLSHPNLLQTLILPSGILSKKGVTNIHQQIVSHLDFGSATKNSIHLHYQEDQLVNTFQPIFQCLAFLHSHDVVHGSLSPEAIVIDQEGNIKLRHWKIQTRNNDYYPSKIATKNQDYKALALIILECALLQPIAKLSKIGTEHLLEMTAKYSKALNVSLMVMLVGIDRHYRDLTRLIVGKLEIPESLNNLYCKLKQSRTKIRTSSPLLMQENDQMKKMMTHKIIRMEDCENKKVVNEKKLSERVTKIGEKKGYDFALKRMSNCRMNNGETENSCRRRKQQGLKFGSPSIKVRNTGNLSKKKHT